MLAQQLINGLVLGAIYCLFSIGFNLIFGVIHVINLVYGVYFAMGAYVALVLSTGLGLPFFAVLPAVICVVGILAAVIDWLLLTPLKGRDGRYLASLIITMGGALFLYSVLSAFFGVESRRFPTDFGPSSLFQIGCVSITGIQVAILMLAPILIGTLFYILKFCRWGIAMRAAADNERASLLMGINPATVTLGVSFLAGALAGTAGMLIGLNFNAVQPYMGEFMMLRGFAIVIIGGLGSLPGAAIAGLGLGVLEILTAAYGSSLYRDVITFSLLLLTLWVFPSGLVKQINARRP
jgi:branched-chain amino acid transport system permease protein